MSNDVLLPNELGFEYFGEKIYGYHFTCLHDEYTEPRYKNNVLPV